MSELHHLTDVGAVVFDVGETLVDETAQWTRAARTAGVTPFALMGVLGALIERGEDHRDAWRILGVDPPKRGEQIGPDLYPDALPCLARLADAGDRIGIAGNQPEVAERELRDAGFEAELIASSAAWGVAKPSTEFFTRVLRTLAVKPADVLYVGDRLDNDILPARALGMRTALLRRGPWGYLHARRPEAEHADAVVGSLDELARGLTKET